MMITDWSDTVFLDTVGVEGKRLSEVLAGLAEEEYNDHLHEWEENAEPCDCVYCQVLVPMATKLEQRIAELEAQLAAQSNDWTYLPELPPTGDTVLVTVRYDDTLCGYDIFVAYYHTRINDWLREGERRITGGKVVAWKPLPQPAPLRTAAPEQQ